MAAMMAKATFRFQMFTHNTIYFFCLYTPPDRIDAHFQRLVHQCKNFLLLSGWTPHNHCITGITPITIQAGSKITENKIIYFNDFIRGIASSCCSSFSAHKIRHHRNPGADSRFHFKSDFGK